MFAQRGRDLILFWGFWAAGVAGLIYEVVWFRALTNTVGGTSYTFSLLVASFMAGLALGGHYGGVFIKRQENHIAVFGWLQLSTAFFGLTTLYIITNIFSFYRFIFAPLHGSFALLAAAQFILVFLVMLVPTTLMGAAFPVIAEAGVLRHKHMIQNVGDIYSINTWGSVVGALAAGFILVPMVGLRAANLAAVAINLTVAFTALAAIGAKRLAILALALIPVSQFMVLPNLPPYLAF